MATSSRSSAVAHAVIDTLAQRFAREQAIPLVVVPADWANITVPRAVIRSNARGPYNAATGMRRSEEMACIATQAAQLRTCAVGLILIWDGSSSGAAAMRQVAIHHQFLLFEYLPL